MISKPLVPVILWVIPFLTLAQHAFCADSGMCATRMLQRQQQLDAASLGIGQSLSNTQAANLDTHQRLQLRQLELQQRMQQQTLEQQQLRQSYRPPEPLDSQPGTIRDTRVQAEQRRLGWERQQQLQQFQAERQQQLQQFQWERQQQSLTHPLAPPQFTIR